METVRYVLLGVGLVCAWLLAQFLVVPFIKLQLRRRESRTHVPQPEEVWMQNDSMLYIDAVSASGVELMSYDPINKTFYRWKDSWPEWQQRLKLHTLWYTGQRRPLKQ
jgi:hypothetical protein